jgi:glycosyltransferase involved in cell wall biosynthesis
VEIIQCDSPSLTERNNLAHHAIHHFINVLNKELNVYIRPTAFKGDIHLSDNERSWVSQVTEMTGEEIPFWIVTAGIDRKCTVNYWGNGSFQEVIDYFKGNIQFVQVGDADHQKFKSVIDFRKDTDLRKLIRLIYHAQGILCPSTVHMHLAAAVESKQPLNHRPCVIVAGGREPAHWEAYPQHQYIRATSGLLCCSQGGCGKSRTVRLRDGSDLNRSHNLCENVSHKLARCMERITVENVVDRMEMYFKTAILQRLTPKQNERISDVLSLGNRLRWESKHLENVAFRQASEQYTKRIPPYFNKFREKGIIICAGAKYLPSAWVCIRMLRKLGCRLPIQIWYLGSQEMNEEFERLLAPLGVKCVDALKIAERHPARILTGWPLKAYAIKHCRFEEVLLLDADNVPVVKPDFLFDTPQYKRTGAIFWPDIRPGIEPKVWGLFGIPYVKEPEFESGQIVINKRKCWRPLCLALWYNEHADHYYQHILGDKDTFHMAFRKLKKSFSFVEASVKHFDGTLCQHDFDGRRIFQHRNRFKWQLVENNPHTPGFLFEAECLDFLNELRVKWLRPMSCLLFQDTPKRLPSVQKYFNELTANIYEYRRNCQDVRRMSFNSNGTIGFGSSETEKYWHVTNLRGVTWVEILSHEHVVCRLLRDDRGHWKGLWNEGEKTSVRLTPETAQTWGLRSLHKLKMRLRHRILFRAPLNGYTGYGLHANQIVTDLQAMGYEFFIRAVDINETFAPIPANVRKAICCQEHPSEWELVLAPPGFGPIAGKKTAHFTMWESTKLSPHAVANLNRCECIIVPTQWNASCFYASGVKRPIYLVPLGIKTDVFSYGPMDMNSFCTFGTAGRLESGGTRKGIGLVIDAFKKAFPAQKDVRLHVKIFPDCQIPNEKDSRIKFNREYFSEKQLAAWFRRLTCFASAARGEGWGLMQHQAMATGRPVIGVRFGGTGEFFNERIGYPLNFQLAPAEDLYTACGLWAEPDERHLIYLLRQVYSNRKDAQKRGKIAAGVAAKYSWSESSRKLHAVLKTIGMID